MRAIKSHHRVSVHAARDQRMRVFQYELAQLLISAMSEVGQGPPWRAG
jgi:hypothetical protein